MAIRDQGSCLHISKIRVYYKYCPEANIEFIHLPETLIDGDATEVEVEGECVANAEPISMIEYGLKSKCVDGEWDTREANWCRCKAGYQSDPIKNTCTICPVGTFQPLRGGDDCKQCPPNTKGLLPGMEECPCIEGHYRSRHDDAYAMCTRSPSSPSNLTIE